MDKIGKIFFENDLHDDIMQDQNQILREALDALAKANELVSESTFGDAEFDVELTVAINVARAALLRTKSLLAEKSGRSNLRLEDI